MKMKKILMSLVVIALAVAAVSGGTFAYFSDNETSTANQFTAGVIDLKIDCSGDTQFMATDNPGTIFARMAENDIKPGAEGEVTISLHLAEGNPADLSMTVANVANAGGANPEPEQVAEVAGVDDAIAAHILCTIWIDDGDNILNGNEVAAYTGPLSEYISVTIPAAAAGSTSYIGWSWALQDVGNEHQGDLCTFDIVFNAAQIGTP